MIPELRHRYNAAFTPERHAALGRALAGRLATPIEFRLSETPCFLPAVLADRLSTVARELVASLLGDRTYLERAEVLVPDAFRVPGAEPYPTFVQVDFGLVQTSSGVEGRLVELQAFPSLYGFQLLLAEAHLDACGEPGLTPFLDGIDRPTYLDLVRNAICGTHDPSEVVLLEIEPERQKTRPDFAATEALWGVQAVDFRALERRGRQLFSRTSDRLTPVRRIYNRVVPDELERRGLAWPFAGDLDVEWAGGPDWFCRLSKFALPFLRHPWVPVTRLLSEMPVPPGDRSGWVLKPLLSFAGGGIVFGPSDEVLAAIPEPDRSGYVLQERVAFTPLIETPHGPTQLEVRVMLVRDGDGYRALLPLGRMGRGLMIGVDHNKGLEWVGSTAVLVTAGTAPTSPSAAA